MATSKATLNPKELDRIKRLAEQQLKQIEESANSSAT